MEEQIKVEELLGEVQIALKDLFVALVRKRGDELLLQFPNGQEFTLALWENKKNNLCLSRKIT